MYTEFKYEGRITDKKKIDLIEIEVTRLVQTDPSIFLEVNYIGVRPNFIVYELKFKCSNYKNFNYLYNIITKK
jgi:hypothetical protein